MTQSDERYMALALALASRGLGNVWPNPAVGCVIVKDSRIVGRGYTAPGGRPHAETQALAQAGPDARGATAYVSLEPCSHHGKTPPCAEALIDAGVTAVVCAVTDSDPRVSGSGLKLLEKHGVEVRSGVLGDAARQLNSGFFNRVEQGRPMLTLKLANSFDGRIATATGESQWITGPAARRVVHALRANHDAVMVGAGTVRADDPSLTVRGLGVSHQPVRVVISRRLDLPLTGQFAQTAKEVPVWLVHGKDADPALVSAWRDLGAKMLPVPLINGQVDPNSALQVLGAEGLTRVFCEGGGSLAASLLEADLVDELIGFTAGIMIGAEGRPSLGALGLERLAQAPRFTLYQLRQIGPDILHHWHRS